MPASERHLSKSAKCSRESSILHICTSQPSNKFTMMEVGDIRQGSCHINTWQNGVRQDMRN